MADLVGALDSVRVTTTTTGTGTLTVGSALAGWLTPAQAGGVAGQRYTWRVENQTGTLWELFEGVLIGSNPVTISRNRIIRNSSGGTTAVNFDFGTKIITCMALSDRMARLDTDGLLPVSLLPQPLISQLFSNTAVSIPNGTVTTMTWDTIGVNTLGAAGSGGFTTSIGGLYSIDLHLPLAASSGTGSRSISLVVGGVDRNSPVQMASGLSRVDLSASFTVLLSAGVTIQGLALQDSGVVAQAGGNPRAHFTLVRLG